MTFTPQQIRALKHLGPMYKEVRGKSAKVKNEFFEKAYFIWFDYCPMYRPLDMKEEDYMKEKEKERGYEERNIGKAV